jgi:hypothetical protein
MDDSQMSDKDRLSDWWNPNAPAAPVPDLPPMSNRGIVSFFGGNKKEGRWAVPKHFRVLAVFSSVKIDLREAVLQHMESVIEAIAVIGDIQIFVTPDVIVECDGDALLGSFTVSETRRRGAGTRVRPLGGPVVRVTGSAYLGSVTVKVRPRR